jgi:rare lipoprotein A
MHDTIARMGRPRPAYGRDAGISLLVLLALAPLGIGACSHASRAPEAPPSHGHESQSGSPAAVETPAHAPTPSPRAEVQRGYASWYGASLAGHRTANGERFDPDKMTAAHRTLPFGTWVEVRRVDGGAAVRVRITDRGPFGHDDRIVDLSRAAADQLGMRRSGVALVEVKVVEGP